MSETKNKIIHGVAFAVTQPYAAGHVLNEAEAKTLNQVRSENIGNNVREKVKELLEAGNQAAAEQLVAERDSSYVFTIASAGGQSKAMDPIEREARTIAKELIKQHLASQGRKLTDIPEGLDKDTWADKLEENIEKVASSEKVLDAAKKAVDAKKKRLASLADIDLG